MKISFLIFIFAFVLFGKSAESTEDFLLDDFSEKSGVSAIGTTWQSFTDRVMGGVSEGTHQFADVAVSRIEFYR